jgi:hypothetical protein
MTIAKSNNKNYFKQVFTGSLGFFAAKFLYSLIIFLIFLGLIAGIYLIYKGQNCKTIKDDSVKDANGNSKVITKCDEFSKLYFGKKFEVVLGYILAVVCGLILFIYLLPYILVGMATSSFRK